MTLDEIKAYLQQENDTLGSSVMGELEQERQTAIAEKNEKLANECWCIAQIYYIQKDFLTIFYSLKRKQYQTAWEALIKCQIQLSALEKIYDIGSLEQDPYHLIVIKNTLPEYEKLFPYEYFMNREVIVKKERCSICGKPVTLRGGCGHIPGRLYMGDFCVREPIDQEYLGLAVVQDPFEKSGLLQPYAMEYNYDMLDALINSLHTPYDFWYVEIVREPNPAFKNVQRNDPCPCGSGKKFKYCCMNDPEKSTFAHYRIKLMNEPGEKLDRPLKMIKG